MGIQPHLQEKILAKTRVLGFWPFLTIFDIFEKMTNLSKNEKTWSWHFQHFWKCQMTRSWLLTILKMSTSLDVGFFKNHQNHDFGQSPLFGMTPPRSGWTPLPHGGTPLQGGTPHWGTPPRWGGPKNDPPLRGGTIYIYNIYIGYFDHFTTTPNRRVGVYLLFL